MIQKIRHFPASRLWYLKAMENLVQSRSVRCIFPEMHILKSMGSLACSDQFPMLHISVSQMRNLTSYIQWIFYPYFFSKEDFWLALPNVSVFQLHAGTAFLKALSPETETELCWIPQLRPGDKMFSTQKGIIPYYLTCVIWTSNTVNMSIYDSTMLIEFSFTPGTPRDKVTHSSLNPGMLNLYPYFTES